MDLPDGGGRERFFLKGGQLYFPLVLSEVLLQHGVDLIQRHDMSAFPRSFEGLPDGGRNQVILLDAEHLGEFERSSSHFAELLSYFVSRPLINGLYRLGVTP